MPIRRTVATGLLGLTGLTLAACGSDPAADQPEDTVTMRVWSDEAARAYSESLQQFTDEHPQIEVRLEVVPWSEYWDRMPRDVADGTMADIYWTNAATFAGSADRGDLLEVTDDVDPREWTEAVRDLYTRDGAHWGVPQTWESVALYYNADLLEAAGVDPEGLHWDPTGEQDTLIDAARALTRDEAGHTADDARFDPEEVVQYGFNAEHDGQGVWLNFLAENGADFQDENGTYTFASEEGAEAFGYLVDLIHTHHVAPPATETNADGDYARELFAQGELALFQAGPDALPHLGGAGFEWGVAPKIAGPLGRVSVVHSVAAVADAGTDDPGAVRAVLAWLASAEGQRGLAEAGIGLPAAAGAQDAYAEYWAGEGVDVQPFLDAGQGQTVPAPMGPHAEVGADVISPVLQEMFAGRIPVADALQQAQAAANEAIAP